MNRPYGFPLMRIVAEICESSVYKIDVYGGVFYALFLSPATRKVPKETPLKGERRLKIGETIAIFNQLYALYAPILRDPLPLKNPPLLLAEGERWWRNAYKHYEFKSWCLILMVSQKEHINRLRVRWWVISVLVRGSQVCSHLDSSRISGVSNVFSGATHRQIKI